MTFGAFSKIQLLRSLLYAIGLLVFLLFRADIYSWVDRNVGLIGPQWVYYALFIPVYIGLVFLIEKHIEGLWSKKKIR